MDLLIPATTIIILGGLVKGLTGFGYALISTSLLTIFMPAQQAVAIMIIPLIAGNLELILETDKEELKDCVKNFSGYILSLAAGTTLGMLMISAIPSRTLQVTVGLIAVLYATSKISFIEQKIGKIKEICFRTWDPFIGTTSGVIYGASNIGVPIITYLKSRELSRQKFTGTLAAIILILSLYRIILAQATGIYSGNQDIILSLILAIPTLISVKTGQIISHRLPRDKLEKITLLLILVIGLKLILPF